MKIQQISPKDPLTTSFLNNALSYSQLLQLFEFYSMTGNAEYRKKTANNEGISTRALGVNYTQLNPNPEYANPSLKIVGGQVAVDIAYERRGGDVVSERLRQVNGFALNFASKLNNLFINGDSSSVASEFNGIKKLMPSGRVITPVANGIPFPAGGYDNTTVKQQQAIFEQLVYLTQLIPGGAGALIMNGLVLARLTSAFGEQIQMMPSDFGKPIPYFNGVPLIDAGFADIAGGLVIPQTETCGTSTDTSSIYAVRFGEATDVTMMSNLGLTINDVGQVGTNYVHTIELDVAVVLLNDLAVAQLKGVKLT